MALPTGTDYATSAVPPPDSDVTEFIIPIDLSTLPQEWWDAVDTSDPTRGRASKDDGVEEAATELAANWYEFDEVAETGWAFVLWSGTLPSAGTDIRLYPPQAANSAYAAGDTFGQHAAYPSSVLCHLPKGGGADQTSGGNDGTAVGGVTFGGAAGKVGPATDYDGNDDECELPTAAFDFENWGGMTVFAWAYPTAGGFNPFFSQIDADSGADARPVSVAMGGSDNWRTQLNNFTDNVATGFAATQNAWQHVVGTWEADTETAIWQDGVKEGSVATSISALQASSARVGVLYDADTTVYSGRLNDLRVDDVRRSDPYIKLYYSLTDDPAAAWSWTWEATASVSGTVTASSDADPIEGVEVIWKLSDGTLLGTDITDAQGNYSISADLSGASLPDTTDVTARDAFYADQTKQEEASSEGESLTVDFVLDAPVAVQPIDPGELSAAETVLEGGADGESDHRLQGGITPCRALIKGSTIYLYYIGASGDRADDGGPAYRKLHLATAPLSDPSNLTRSAENPILDHRPVGHVDNEEEEGIFCLGAQQDLDGNVVIHFSGLEGVTSTQVDSDIVYSESADGETGWSAFEDLIRGSDGGGDNDEIFPFGLILIGQTWHLFWSDRTNEAGPEGDWNARYSSGPARNDIGGFAESTDLNVPTRGAAEFASFGDPVRLSEDEVLVPMKVDWCNGQTVELLTAPVDDLTSLSEHDIFSLSDLCHGTLVLDRENGRWLLYYMEVGEADPDDSVLKLRTAVARSPDGTPLGDLSNAVSWTWTSDNLTGLAEGRLYRDTSDPPTRDASTLLETFPDPTPGEAVSYEDDGSGNLEAPEGGTTYYYAVELEDGVGNVSVSNVASGTAS